MLRTPSARKIGTNRTAVTGSFASKKNGCEILCESSIEMDFVELLEFDRNVLSFKEQPIKLEYQLNNKASWHFPDFLVFYTEEAKRRHDLTDTLFEVKSHQDLEKNKSKYDARFLTVCSLANDLGYHYEVITDLDIRNDYLDNVKFLNYYSTESCDPFLTEMIVSFIRESKISSPQEIVASISGDYETKTNAIYCVWSLVARGVILTSLSKKLTMNSDLWISE